MELVLALILLITFSFLVGFLWPERPAPLVDDELEAQRDALAAVERLHALSWEARQRMHETVRRRDS